MTSKEVPTGWPSDAPSAGRMGNASAPISMRIVSFSTRPCLLGMLAGACTRSPFHTVYGLLSSSWTDGEVSS
jgi:hypothetical protein